MQIKTGRKHGAFFCISPWLLKTLFSTPSERFHFTYGWIFFWKKWKSKKYCVSLLVDELELRKNYVISQGMKRESLHPCCCCCFWSVMKLSVYIELINATRTYSLRVRQIIKTGMTRGTACFVFATFVCVYVCVYMYIYMCVCVCVCVCVCSRMPYPPTRWVKAFCVRIKQPLDTDNNWNPSIQDCNISLSNITTKQSERDESTK